MSEELKDKHCVGTTENYCCKCGKQVNLRSTPCEPLSHNLFKWDTTSGVIQGLKVSTYTRSKEAHEQER